MRLLTLVMLVALQVAALDLAALWQRVRRETNSYAATRRGVRDYEKKQYTAAVNSFARAHAIARTASSAFNAGTAEVASGRREEGSATLGRAMTDPAVRPDALYNRGTSALASNAFEHAVRDYREALRLKPDDVQAKRNLEIALLRKREKERTRGTGQQDRQEQQSGRRSQQQLPERSERQGEQRGQQPDVESLLRSVQQQEREELARMRRGRTDSRRVGW